MKKLLLSALLLTGLLFAAKAQDENGEKKKKVAPTQTEWNFNMPQDFVNIRDYAYLPNKARMVIELTNPEQYKELANLDSILNVLMKEIAFYKDSLENGSGSVRIDYAIDEAFAFNKIRFKKHPADGDIFMSKPTDKARLKLDQDTIRIYYRHNPVNENYRKPKHRWDYPMYHSRFYQVTFCVNNYTDIAAIAADKTTLQHALDTLYATKRPQTLANPYINPSSARYNPYAPDNSGKKKYWLSLADTRFKQYGGLVLSDKPKDWNVIRRTDNLSLDVNLGVGLVRNFLAPYAEAGITIDRQSRRPYQEKYNHVIWGLFVSAYVMFEKNAAGDYITKPNNFINLRVGEGDGISMGVGYLFSQSGNYFKGITTKAFVNVTLLKKGLTLSPEIIFTNDFKQVFPGLTLKVF